jgi:hypothetical protein
LVHKILQEERHVVHLELTAPAQFMRTSADTSCDHFCGVEGDNLVLAFEQIDDDDF